MKGKASSALTSLVIVLAVSAAMCVPHVPLRAQTLTPGEACSQALGYLACSGQSGPGGNGGPRIGYDPCFLAQNAMRPCTSDSHPASIPAGVDPSLVGTWELPVKGGPWILKILSRGTYDAGLWAAALTESEGPSERTTGSEPCRRRR